MVVFDTAWFKILCESMCESVGVVHRSRGGWDRGVAMVRWDSFRGDFLYGGWGRGIVFQYMENFNRCISATFKFLVIFYKCIC